MTRTTYYPFLRSLVTACWALLLSNTVLAAVGIPAQIAKSTIPAGESGQVISISAFNDGAAVSVDVYVVFLLPDGSFISYDQYGEGISPWYSNIVLPQGFEYPLTPLVTLPGLGEGRYTVYTALTRPGTLEFLALHEQTFTVISNSPGESSRWGVASLSEQRVLDPMDGNSIETIVSAGAFFSGSNSSYLLSREIVDGVDPTLEQCVFSSVDIGDIDFGDIEITPLDAGERVTLTALNSGGVLGALDLVKDDDASAAGIIAYLPPKGVELPSGLISSERSFRFNGYGGPDVGPFSVTVPGVDALRLSQPTLANLDSIDSQRDFAFSWNGNRSAGQVGVNLSGTSGDFSSTCSISCLFVDDGDAIIRSSVLAEYRTCVGNGAFPLPDIPGLPGFDLGGAFFSIQRVSFKLMDTLPAELDFGAATVATGESRMGVSVR